MNDLVKIHREPPVTRIVLRGARHLDHALLDDLERALDRVEGDDEIDTVGFENEGPDFLVGVDSRWVVERIETDDLPAIVAFVQRGQQWLRRLDLTPLVTCARIRGHTTGAGAEWISACDVVVAARGARIGLPETGLGIHPALGGTQRVPRRLGWATARWAVLTGTYLDVTSALALGWIDAIEPADPTREGRRAGRVDFAPASRPGLGEELTRVFEQRSLDELLEDPREADSRPVRQALARLRHRAPIALRIADDLLAAATRVDLATGLQAEIDALATVYATEDAWIGMRASAEGRRAARFTGR